ncbi:GNAT family N-acetyltransferase [bacterium]|nr:GNAT family N-acetyltransferase [candidate division CSSED10-310 bacterium]
MFELLYEPLIISDNLKSWEIAINPWDTETFGFGVSVLKPLFDSLSGDETASFEKALKVYSDRKRTRIIITSIPAEQIEISFFLQRAGFRFIDLSYKIRYETLKYLSIETPANLSLEQALPEELDTLIEMAGRLFQHGRYHQDCFIPKSLADQRYKDWLRRSLKPDNPQQLLTVKFQNSVCGFSIVEYHGTEGYLHLHAIDSKWRGKKLGIGMIVESLRYLHNAGAENVETKISASNLNALNMHSHLNGHFIDVSRILHWHQPVD